MVDLVRLPAGASVPEDEDYVLISRSALGALMITIRTGPPNHKTFKYDTNIPDMATAIHRAKREADHLAIPFIHVAEGADA